MKRWLLTPALALAMAALVHAAPQIEADPNTDYPIHPQAGAWVIVAANYKGSDGASLARQLVHELRTKHNLPAYVWNYGEKQRADRKAEEERWKQQHPDMPFKHWKIEDEYAVMIGGFDTMDQARNYMNDVVKKLPLPKLTLPGGKTPYDTILVGVEGPNKTMQVKRAEVNPLSTSFVSRNPTLAPTQKKADPFLKELNAEEDYSLLKCPEPYTLAVQMYTADATYVSQTKDHSTVGNFLSSLWGGDKDKGKSLTAAALQAHEMAKVLKSFKFDAYVLHTRNSSIVTIGGFKGPTDPGLQSTVAQLASMKELAATKQKYINFDKLNLFAIPYEIPRP